MKLILKLLVVALVANASWRVGSAYLTHYKFKDAVQQTAQFRGNKSDEALKVRVMELAGQFDVPVTDEQVTLRSSEHQTTIDCAYTRVIEVAPGFKTPWSFSFHIDTLSGML